MSNATGGLSRTLGPWMLWGLGVGYVISGMYFGWNLGLEKGGTAGLALATGVVILLYITFTFSYTELACAIPKAGGVFDYATRAIGREWGFVAGARAAGIPVRAAGDSGGYRGVFSYFFPGVPVKVIAVGAFLVFTALNIYGVKAAAGFELVITLFAVFELLLFAGICFPHFQWKNISRDALPHGLEGVWSAIPFAVWFFLGIEGVANVAEEAIRPQRNVLIGFGSALVTLIVLCVLVFLSSIGVAGWQAIVYPAPGATPSDSPLPLALSKITGTDGWTYHLLITIGLMGLVASFHGIILAASRATLEFGRARCLPAFLGRVHVRRHTPVAALLVNMGFGIVTLLLAPTEDIITISVMGALSLYVLSMISVVALRRKEPGLERPFRVPLYPVFPIVALVIGFVCLVAMITLNIKLSGIYFLLLALSYIWFHFLLKSPSMPNKQSLPELLEGLAAAKTEKVKLAITDIDGVLRGKVISFDKFRSIAEKGFGFCDVVFGWDAQDQAYDNGAFTGWHTGYPDAVAAVDISTLRRVPWEGGIPFFLADLKGEAVCPRSLLKKVIGLAAELGYSAVFSQEFEWFNFRAGSDVQVFEDLRPLSQGMFGYSILRASQNSDYFHALFDGLKQFDVPLEGLHTETGPGVYEAAIVYADVLEAADRAVLFKSGVKEIASHRGYSSDLYGQDQRDPARLQRACAPESVDGGRLGEPVL
ncbi:amino acid permease [Puia sp. P3]|uniref:amino acid permease n=1 Tax=Puia sp. P3 TaxID=3423952 RepID=UPI003D673F6E